MTGGTELTALEQAGRDAEAALTRAVAAALARSERFQALLNEYIDLQGRELAALKLAAEQHAKAHREAAEAVSRAPRKDVQG